MAIRVPSRLYERPGTRRFSWRASLPKDLRDFARTSEIRLTLREERRSEAVKIAHHLNADLPRLFAELRRLKVCARRTHLAHDRC